MTLFRVASDIHTEFMADIPHKIERIFSKNILPPMESDPDTVLIIAGDLGSSAYPHAFKTAVEYLSKRFKFILIVAGNHEYYNSNLKDCIVDLNKHIEHLPNVIFDNFEKVPLDYISGKNKDFFRTIWMATLWNNYDNDPVIRQAAWKQSNDFKNIRNLNDQELFPEALVEVHDCMVGELNKGVVKDDIIVTHHPVSLKSSNNPFYREVFCYCNDMDRFILDKEPKFVIHGHIHESADYHIGKTRVICNPYGYHGYKVNKKYNPYLTIEI